MLDTEAMPNWNLNKLYVSGPASEVEAFVLQARHGYDIPLSVRSRPNRRAAHESGNSVLNIEGLLFRPTKRNADLCRARSRRILRRLVPYFLVDGDKIIGRGPGRVSYRFMSAGAYSLEILPTVSKAFPRLRLSHHYWTEREEDVGLWDVYLAGRILCGTEIRRRASRSVR